MNIKTIQGDELQSINVPVPVGNKLVGAIQFEGSQAPSLAWDDAGNLYVCNVDQHVALTGFDLTINIPSGFSWTFSNDGSLTRNGVVVIPAP